MALLPAKKQTKRALAMAINSNKTEGDRSHKNLSSFAHTPQLHFCSPKYAQRNMMLCEEFKQYQVYILFLRLYGYISLIVYIKV